MGNYKDKNTEKKEMAPIPGSCGSFPGQPRAGPACTPPTMLQVHWGQGTGLRGKGWGCMSTLHMARTLKLEIQLHAENPTAKLWQGMFISCGTWNSGAEAEKLVCLTKLTKYSTRQTVSLLGEGLVLMCIEKYSATGLKHEQKQEQGGSEIQAGDPAQQSNRSLIFWKVL